LMPEDTAFLRVVLPIWMIWNITAVQIYEGINREVFHNHNLGSNLYLDNLKGANGELGLRVGDTDKYFGVINVGDEKKLHDLAMNNGILGTEKDFSESLFAQINQPQPKQEINLLIGSKKFSEGWSSWRVSSMGLMNIGKSEGSQIIQLFGRGVRLQGYEFSLKRSLGLDEYQKPANIKSIRKDIRPSGNPPNLWGKGQLHGTVQGAIGRRRIAN
jgi:hypothetical protein